MLLPDGQRYAIHHGDCILHQREMPPQSIAFSIFSVPFPSVYSYTNQACDIGNSEELDHEAKLHFSWFFKSLLPVMWPGRVVIVHCQQIIRMKRSGGDGGMFDFRGLLIRLAKRAGFIYDYDWLVRKGPQAQAIRTRSRSLQFKGLEADRAQSRGAMCDYVIKLLAPGDNKIPIDSEGQVSREDWIHWAEGTWDDIRETDTLNVKEARTEADCRHICALQLSLINRCVRMFSNPGEIVHSSFTGIGSELDQALRLGRRAYGCEIKPEYYAAAIKNCERAIAATNEREQVLPGFE